MGDRWLVVGLGNPGPRYAGNRHNVGWHVVDRLADLSGIALSRAKFKGRYGNGDYAGQSLVLLEPDTFMNLSGQSVSPARSFFEVEPARILVVHDELDLPFGTLRLKVGGGHGGHNGLRSIMAELGTGDFVRLRVGIGRPPKGDAAGFVLQDFGPEERPWLSDLNDRAAAAIRRALEEGPAKAMNVVNAEAVLPKAGRSA
ncbi:MAG: aminoacyl-tRNA hydrolase [Bradymonadia bacterium]|jgi:PTH1 family peptidyl-tRNA hydrolase